MQQPPPGEGDAGLVGGDTPQPLPGPRSQVRAPGTDTSGTAGPGLGVVRSAPEVGVAPAGPGPGAEEAVPGERQASLNPNDHKLDEELCQTLTQRYVSIMNRLQSLGYNGRVHPALTEQLVNAYGILRERPELAVSEGGSYTVDFLQRVLVETVHPSMLTDALLLLSCLSQLAHDDGKPMFIW